MGESDKLKEIIEFIKRYKSVTKKEIEVGCECGKPHCYYIVHAHRTNEGSLQILEPKK